MRQVMWARVTASPRRYRSTPPRASRWQRVASLGALVFGCLALWGMVAWAQQRPMPPTPGVEAPRLQGHLTVFTAASLTAAFQDIAATLEQGNPGTKVTFNFSGSSTLRTQLAQGARADVFASADEPNMHGAHQDGTIAGDPRIFARNLLVVIVPAPNPAGIATLQDLARSGLKLVLARKEVPVGNYARQSLAKMSQEPAFGPDFAARVLENLVSEETNVKQVVTKVQLGEADAGVVYATDVTPAVREALRVLAIPEPLNVVARYPIAVVKGAANEVGARAFIDYILSPAGQAILTRHGFLAAGAS